MENRVNNGNSIEIAPAHQGLIDSLVSIVAEWKKAEATLKLVVQGILQQGGARNDLQYAMSDDGLRMVPAQIRFTAQQLEDIAAQQAASQGQEN